MAPSNEAEESGGEPFVITRVFRAPRQRVWDAWTKPEQMIRWWGKSTCRNPIAETDVKVGGRFRVQFWGEGGEHHSVSGVYRERLTLASGRFAMIEDGLGFQLVPWRPALDQHLGQHISGVILYDETLRQKSADGTPFPALLARQGVIPGIKVDTGAKDMALCPGETVTEPSLKYVNRLSDFLFVASRYANDKGKRDVLWKPGQNR